MNPLKRLGEQGQSVWLDYIRRSLLTGGDLQRMVDEDGLKGVTSNPAIFEKAIAGSTDYKTARTRRWIAPPSTRGWPSRTSRPRQRC
jgi:transaldolase/glucose-6-phosphate isomerase